VKSRNGPSSTLKPFCHSFKTMSTCTANEMLWIKFSYTYRVHRVWKAFELVMGASSRITDGAGNTVYVSQSIQPQPCVLHCRSWGCGHVVLKCCMAFWVVVVPWFCLSHSKLQQKLVTLNTQLQGLHYCYMYSYYITSGQSNFAKATSNALGKSWVPIPSNTMFLGSSRVNTPSKMSATFAQQSHVSHVRDRLTDARHHQLQ